MKSPRPPLKKEKTRRTKKERTEQICNEWAQNTMLFAPSESFKEFRALGPPNSIKRQQAVVLLAKMAENLVPALSVIESKTGPKPRSARNPTDDDIATLCSCIRMILELSVKTNIPSIIATTMSVLRLARDYLEKHLLLTAAEAYLVRGNLMHWIGSSSRTPAADETWRTPDNLTEVDPLVSLRQWAGAKIPSDVLRGDQVTHSNHSKRLDAALVKLVRLLDLDKAAFIKAERYTVHRDPNDDEQCHLDFPRFNSVPELGLKRKEILWSAVGRLIHLQTLLHETTVAWRLDEPENLLLGIEAGINPFLRAISTTRNSTVATSLGVVKRIIVSASVRQGISPFARVLPELDRPFPSSALPGQLSTGLGDEFMFGDGQASSKHPPVGRMKRRKPRDK